MLGREYLGEFEHLIILALLRPEDRAYGVTVRQEIELRTKREVSIGAVYATLDRLETKGYIKSHHGDPTPERGGRSKRFFRVTTPGDGSRRAGTERTSVHDRRSQTCQEPLMISPPDFVQPPRIAAWLINLFSAPQEAESMLGDLHEEFLAVAKNSSAPSARSWYRRRTIPTVAHLLWAGFRVGPWVDLRDGSRRILVDEVRLSVVSARDDCGT